VLESYPGNPRAQAMEGVARIHLGPVEEGLDLLGRAIESNNLDPNRFRLYRVYQHGRTGYRSLYVGIACSHFAYETSAYD